MITIRRAALPFILAAFAGCSGSTGSSSASSNTTGSTGSNASTSSSTSASSSATSSGSTSAGAGSDGSASSSGGIAASTGSTGANTASTGTLTASSSSGSSSGGSTGGLAPTVMPLQGGLGPFHAPLVYRLQGTSPGAVVAADFDEDGAMDLAAEGYTFIVYFGGGDGSLTRAEVYALQSVGVATGDLNHDGHADLVTWGPNGPIALLNDGHGHFTPVETQSNLTNAGISQLALADFNGDGVLDLLGGAGENAFGSSSVVVMLGAGDGTFSAPQTMTYSSQGNAYYAFGDFNEDGKLDLVVTFDAGTLVALGHGDGTFANPLLVHVGAHHASVAVGDFDGDGHLDLAGANGDPNVANAGTGLAMLAGHGNGTFAAPLNTLDGVSRTTVVAADINGDGRLDLVASDGEYLAPEVLLNDGTGRFTSTGEIHDQQPDGNLLLADMNGDGVPDIICTDPYLQGLSITLVEAGGFPDTDVQINSQPGSLNISAADFNGDGVPDVAIVAGAYAVLLSQPDGGYTLTNNGYVNGYPSRVDAADLNRDGFVDLVEMSDWSGTNVGLGMGLADGGFADGGTYDSYGTAATLTLADMNGDGFIDLVNVGSHGEIAVSLGSANGFAAPTLTLGGNQPTSIAVADFNGDGFPDLALGNGDGTVQLVVGLADGGMGLPGPAAASPLTYGSFTQLAAGDWNGDGHLDVIGLSPYGVYVFPGTGQFSLGAAQPLLVSQQDSPIAMLVGDFDRDGKIDAALFEGGSILRVLMNAGDGGAGDIFTYAISTDVNGPMRAQLIDMNHDGKPDLLSGRGTIDWTRAR
ncbi:MAG: VCBS repeat-containing protein [Deltaproteobacteria bacterium]|nr:VCBS repeat-containing protein [Deltaproteobacteria bacterium]